MKKHLTYYNLYATIANSNGTMDMLFIIEDKAVWVKGAKVPDDIGEFYFDDADNLRKAVETGQIEIV